MSNKGTAVVVGYGPGVGAAVAEAFAREGFALALIARNSEKLNIATKEMGARGLTARGFVVDVSNASALIGALQQARDELGAIEVLVYNAAHWRPGPVLETTPESFEQDFRVNVSGALVAARTVAPAMVTRGRGSILFTGGGLAMFPSRQAPSLSVGKAGIRALALMLADELASKGVRVGTVTIAGTVAPGTSFAPEKIAEVYLALHRSPPDPKTAEVVFRG
jgi:NAD(P)-dependent dehydrogenase (short-subunit alcohol dehydrogenase family)